MAFFPRSLYDSNASFAPLFRLLDDFDSYSRQGMSGRRTSIPSWQPKFDIRETREAYELHGELPGINKENIHIEFTEPQTMLIRGKTERTYTAGNPPADFIDGTTTSSAITEAGEGAKKASDEVYKSVPHETGAEATEKEMAKAKEPVDKAKYWLSERSVGEFSRSFNFPTPVDQESVTASFKDGILNIVAPKAKKQESRRIAIS
ncbi:SHSP domain-containing protein [Fusarium keratoplasticum]|nr:SHSP domain-containing protein [Fusarium keratoplasticum]